MNSDMREVLLVTGASRGIGAATAVLAAERGYDVAIGYRQDSDAAEIVAGQVRDRGARAVTIPGDVANEADVESMFATVDAELGTIAVLVNNAGTLERQMRVDEMTAERIERILRVNVLSVFLCCRAAVRRMSTRYAGAGGAHRERLLHRVPDRRRRRVRGLRGVEGRAGHDDPRAGDGSRGGRHPRQCGTAGIHQHPHPRARRRAGTGRPVQDHRPDAARGGEADEVARTILWLASDEASYCTGSLLDVSGGR